MARMSHKFLRKIARFDPSYMHEDVEGNDPRVSAGGQAEVKREPERQLSPLTSIASVDEEEHQVDSAAEADDDKNAPLFKATISASRIRLDKGKETDQRRYKPRRSAVARLQTGSMGGVSARQSSRTVREALKPSQSKSRLATGPVMCHQCRSTNKWAKMTCSNTIESAGRCKRKYCANCIVKRYPIITFDTSSKTFICPVCTGDCNCTVCCRKRGEEYVSTRFSKDDEEKLKKIEAGELVSNCASTSISTKQRPAKKMKRLHVNANFRSSIGKKSVVDPLKKTTNIIENYWGVHERYWGGVLSSRSKIIGGGCYGESLSHIIVATQEHRHMYYHFESTSI